MPARTSPTRVVVAGVHGHGRWHLRNLARLADVGRVQLVGVCDPQPQDGELRQRLEGVPHSAELAQALERHAPDVVVLCTPIHTHVELAELAMASGSHVLLEKPPAPTREGHERLRASARAAGVVCQVGFQSFGSHAVARASALVADGSLGELRGIGAAGAWVRGDAYYARARWAGRRQMDGRPIVDGALTNPFAHATATALRIDGADGPGGGFAELALELHHANDIEADDTSCLTGTTVNGTRIAVAVSLCAPTRHEAYVLVHGSRGSAQIFYKTHRLRTVIDGVEQDGIHGETDLMENLLDHLADPGVPLLAPVERTLGFAQVIEAVRLADAPRPIPPPHARRISDDAGDRVVVEGIVDLVHRSAAELASFRDLGVPWAREASRTADARTADAQTADAGVTAVGVGGPATGPASGGRP